MLFVGCLRNILNGIDIRVLCQCDPFIAITKRFSGRIRRIRQQMINSGRMVAPLYMAEYSTGDIPSGAKAAKKMTPEAKWQRKFNR